MDIVYKYAYEKGHWFLDDRLYVVIVTAQPENDNEIEVGFGHTPEDACYDLSEISIDRDSRDIVKAALDYSWTKSWISNPEDLEEIPNPPFPKAA